MNTDFYHHASHCKYLIQYHIIWCPKFRFPVLSDGVDGLLKSILEGICSRYDFEIRAMEVMPDHVHLFVDCPQTVSPSMVVRTLKSVSAIEIFKECPWLKRFYGRCGKMWSNGYFISTIGTISAETVKHYIEEQKYTSKNHGRKK